MKAAISFTSVALAGVLAGYLGMRAKSASENAPALPAASAKVADAARVSPQAVDPDAGPAKHDLASLLKWCRQQEISGSRVEREIERLDKGELRALLVDLAGDGQADPQVSASTAGVAAKELFKREGAAAFDWVAGLDEGIRKAVYPRILEAALVSDPIAYKDRFEAYKKEYGGPAASAFIYPMIGGATERGAEDMIKLQEAYGDALKQYMVPVGTLPEDFDFHRFFTGLPASSNDSMRNTFLYWVAKDREAAWSGFKEVTKGGAPGTNSYFPALFDGVASVAGPAKAAEWLAPKLAELPDEQRARALGAFGMMGPLETQMVTAIMPLLESDSDRMTLAQRAVVASAGGSKAGVAALTALASDEQRTEVLLNHVRTFGYEKMPPASRDRFSGELEKLMEKVNLPEAMRNQVTGEIKARSGAGG
ncbi:hypothetical protein [Luteolibacter soli]|uniref:HEAT repeat domain-containing protein n=1 Tax=Luteolibacter soli TaxID=3135280 RepID=A0ABU9AUY6_9BACT